MIKPENLYELYSNLLAATRLFAAENGYQETLPALEGIELDNPNEASVNFGRVGHEDRVLPSSHTLCKQVAATYLRRVFCIGPCYRDEQCSTTHLSAFHQLEFEQELGSLSQIVEMARRLLSRLGVGENFALRTIDLAEFADVIRSATDYEKFAAIQRKQFKYATVVFLHPPSDVQPANRLNGDGTAEGFEIFLPEDFGEVISGGVRQHSYTVDQLNKWSRSATLLAPPMTGGFGLGLERLVKFLMRADDIRTVVLPHVYRPY